MRRAWHPAVPLAAFTCVLAAAVPARAGVAAAAHAPDRAAALGPLCREDTAHFRLWWSDLPGAPGALPDADGSCATTPSAVTEAADAARRARSRAIALGFPAPTGDAPPAMLRDARYTRQLLRAAPDVRAGALGGMSGDLRGRYLGGLSAAARRAVLRGLAPALTRRLLADMRRARAGRPADFVGGDRRIDIVLDGTGATAVVEPHGRVGLAVCRTALRDGRRTFVAAWITVLAGTDTNALRTTVAHELMHVVQCTIGVDRRTPPLLKEGSAEWFAGLSEPAAFPGATTADGTVSGGNARAVSFCNAFAPLSGGLQNYASWPVWDALDTARDGTVRGLLTRARTRPEGGVRGLIARVGDARWSAALVTAARAVCGGARSPSGTVGFAPGIRDFLGARAPRATPAAPASVLVPAGGVMSVSALWRGLPAAAVAVRVTAPDTTPEALARALVSGTAAGPLTALARDGGAVIDVPASALGEGAIPVTIANPSTRAPIAVTVQVLVTPPAV